MGFEKCTSYTYTVGASCPHAHTISEVPTIDGMCPQHMGYAVPPYMLSVQISLIVVPSVLGLAVRPCLKALFFCFMIFLIIAS